MDDRELELRLREFDFSLLHPLRGTLLQRLLSLRDSQEMMKEDSPMAETKATKSPMDEVRADMAKPDELDDVELDDEMLEKAAGGMRDPFISEREYHEWQRQSKRRN